MTTSNQTPSAAPAAISVIGCGYVGLTTAVCFAELGYHVIGIENNAAKLAGLRAGAPLFDEPATTALLQKHLKTGNLAFAARIADAPAAPAAAFLAVQTTGGDMTLLQNAAQDALAVMPAGGALVVRSTAAPGTGDALAPAAAKKGVSVVSNPEFLRQGYGVADFQGQKRVIIGADPQDAQAENLMRRLYGNLLQQGCEYCAFTRQEAELTKLMTNAYLANRVSLVNTFADISRAANADADRVIRLLGGDSRIGERYWNYGIGFGGSCLPKDTRLLAKFAAQHDTEAQLLTAALQSNDHRAAAIAARIMAAQASRGGPIVVWGATFKPQSDDLRESQAAKIIDALLPQTTPTPTTPASENTPATTANAASTTAGENPRATPAGKIASTTAGENAHVTPQVFVWEPNCPQHRLQARFPAATINQDETVPQNATLAILIPHTQFSAPLATLPNNTPTLDFTR